MFDMMKEVKPEMTSLKLSTVNAVTELKTEVKEDVARLENNIDNLTAEQAETKTSLAS